MANFQSRFSYAVVPFIIVALIVGAMVIGVVFFVQQRGEQVRREQAQQVAQRQIDEQNKVASKQTDNTDKATSGVAIPVKPNTNTTVSTVATTAQLPQTGPEQGVAQIVAVTMLSLSLAFYISSRRELRLSHL